MRHQTICLYISHVTWTPSDTGSHSRLDPIHTIYTIGMSLVRTMLISFELNTCVTTGAQ